MPTAPRLRAHNIAVSLDGYLAGPDQGPDTPLGTGGPLLHEWAFATAAFRRMHLTADPAPAPGTGHESGGGHESEGGQGLDNDFIERGDAGIGATVMGRNMFGPIRGPWGDQDWRGWWGEEPPYHHPVFVLTHHSRAPLTMRGGTTFHFVTDGPRAALDRAFEAAGGRDVRVGGGAATLQQYLRDGLLDELHLAIVPVLLGGGERLFDRLDGGPRGYRVEEFVSSTAVTHVRLVRDTP